MTVEEQNQETSPLSLPLLPLRDVVVFPNMVTPLFVGREKSIKALELAMESEKKFFWLLKKMHQKMILSKATCLLLVPFLLFFSC